MGEPIAVCFTYTADEYVDAVRVHLQKNNRLNVRRDVIGAIIGTVAGTCLWWSQTSPTWGVVLIALSMVLLLMVCYGWFILPRLMYNGEPKLKQPYELIFSGEGISFRMPGVESKLDWLFYTKWVEDDRFYLLYYGKRNMSVIPRRALNESTDRAFRELLRTKIAAVSTR